ncbi:glycosyltransferase family 10 domain-containing protein [Fretibacter rubidus]|uniref:glycosyltransferase family 10 domain-containing protein n=1 Tax=Fretibacter rubidus TaxID=570162 RepID=UPI00352B8451
MTSSSDKNLRVKFMARMSDYEDPALFLSLLPGRRPHYGGVDFLMDPDARDYDFLVVYDDLTFREGEKKSFRTEVLSCARENTLLVTQEPSSIKIYGPQFLAQYGHVLSRQPRDIVGHPNQIFEAPPLRWFYGRPLSKDDTNYIDFDSFLATPPIPKTADLSTVCSAKQMAATLHKQRYDFTMALKDRLGDAFDVFGRGIRPINDKSEAMDDFRYHIAIENHIEPGYWTEKIADCFLAYCVPLYYGPQDVGTLFPEGSYIPIDIFDIDRAEAIIRDEIKPGSYEARLPAVIEARRRILHDHNLMIYLAKKAKTLHNPNAKAPPRNVIYGRHKFRQAHPFKAASDVLHRIKVNRRR